MDVFLDCLLVFFFICNIWLSACLTQNCNFIIKLFFPNVNPFQTELFSLLRRGGFGGPPLYLKNRL